MAYVPYYTINFRNEQSQEVSVTISKKDGDPDTVVANYEVTQLIIEDKSEGQTKYDSTIITRELILGLWSTKTDVITWETFITAEHDEWLVKVTIDELYYFEGWLTPDEGNAVFQDKPYEITIRATNGLALLKEVPLVDYDGNQFDGDHTLIKYIAGALKQTGLDLEIRCCCQYFNAQMNDKSDSLNSDMFDQVSLNYRTFQRDATTFVSCYDALKIILDKFCRLEYWNGHWHIRSIAELQYLPGGVDYNVDYNPDGTGANGLADPRNHAQIGKSVDIYPINEDQQIYSRFAIKSAKTIYNYVVWPELPKNNKFERGTALVSSSGTVFETDVNGDNTATVIGTYQDYTIDDWAFGSFDGSSIPDITNLPALPAGIDIAYRRSSSNTFGIEFNREIIIEKSTGMAQVVQSEGIPVYAGDKLKLTLDFKLSFNYGDQLNIAIAQVYIAPKGGGIKIWWRDGAGISNTWRQAGAAAQGIFLNYQDASDRTKVYKSLTLESPPIPVDGTVYLQLVHVIDDSLPNMAFFKNVTIEYLPYITGGYIQVKGDYWNRVQNKVFPDVASEEVSISDSPKKAFKGAMLVDGELTTPTWYRQGITEARHFKELLNIARFNHSYRRMYAIEGTFNGLNFTPENDQLNKRPIAFLKRYRMVDIPEPRDFVLVPPMKMDLWKGWITANLVEVRKDADGDADGTQLGDSAEFKYIF